MNAIFFRPATWCFSILCIRTFQRSPLENRQIVGNVAVVPFFYVLLPIYVRCINTASESREKIRCDVTLTWTEDLDQGNYNLIRKRMIAGANLFVRNNPELKIAGDWVGGTVTAIPRHSCYWHETSWAACVGLSLFPRQCEKHGCNPWRIWLTLTDLIVYRWPFWRSLKCLDLRDPLLSACFYDNWHLSTPSWAPSQGPLGSATAPEGRILRVPKSIPGGSGAPCSWYQQSLHAKCTIPKASSSVEMSLGQRPWKFPKIKSYEFYGYGMIWTFFYSIFG